MKRVLLVVVLVAGTTIGVASPAATAASGCSTAGARSLGGWHAGSITASRHAQWFKFRTASSRHALVTLGGLSANLSLGLYDASCQLVASSDHRRNRFEEIYRYLPGGKYYTKVSAVDGAISRFDLRFRSLPEGDVILDRHASIHDGDLDIVGEMLNNRSVGWYMAYFSVIFYNRYGSVIGRDDDGGFAWQVLRPRSRVTIGDVSPLRKGYDHYRFTNFHTEPLTRYTPLPQPIANTPSRPWTGQTGRRHYPGGIRNTSDTRALMISVTDTLFDSHGRVRYSGWAPVVPDDIPPGGIGGYDVVFDHVTGVNAFSTHTNSE